MKEDDEDLNTVEMQMQVGARIQRFYDILQDYHTDLNSWNPEDDHEKSMKEAKEELLYSVMDDFSELFDNIIAWKR